MGAHGAAGSPKHEADNMAMGRPTKLTEEVIVALCEALADGKPYRPACEALGIDDSTFRLWRIKGRNGEEGYAEFFTRVTRARAEGELKLWGRAVSAEAAAARNAQWGLERGFGNRYIARLQVKVEEELEGLLDAVERVCSAKDCGCHAALLEALAARAGGEEAPEAEGFGLGEGGAGDPRTEH
jgi:hypothetical protein